MVVSDDRERFERVLRRGVRSSSALATLLLTGDRQNRQAVLTAYHVTPAWVRLRPLLDEARSLQERDGTALATDADPLLKQLFHDGVPLVQTLDGAPRGLLPGGIVSEVRSAVRDAGVVAFPLVTPQGPRGALAFLTTLPVAAHEHEVMHASAETVALEIQFQEMEDRVQRLRLRLGGLHVTLAELLESEDTNRVLETTAHVAQAFLRASFVALSVYDQSGEPVHFYSYQVGFEDDAIHRLHSRPRGRGVLGLLRQGETVRTPDVRRHAAFGGYPAGHPDVSSFLGVPVRTAAPGMTGGLYVGNKMDGSGEFDQDDEQVLTVLARHVGIALEKDYERRQLEEAARSHLRALATMSAAVFDTPADRIEACREGLRLVALNLGVDGAEAPGIVDAVMTSNIGLILLGSAFYHPGEGVALTPEQEAVFLTHPLRGLELIPEGPTSEPARQAVRWHHENWDGTGYPDGLKGEATPLVARIARVWSQVRGQVFLRGNPKDSPIAWGKAMAEVEERAGTWFDPRVSDAFIAVYGSGGFRRR